MPKIFSSFSELVTNGQSRRNWRGIGIALVAIFIICALIATTVVYVGPADSPTTDSITGQKLTLDDFLEFDLVPARFNATWISDWEFLYQNEGKSLVLFNAATGNSSVFLPSEVFKQMNAQSWHLSADRRFFLLASDMQKVFRYSFLAFYWIYDINNNSFQPLTLHPSQHEKLQIAKWGPVNNSIVFVTQNNVYYKPSAHSDEVKALTVTAPDEAVFNGVPDWVYEEEILSSNSALWFSKDGKYLCFASFNDTLVPSQPIEWFGDPKHLLIYPQPDIIKYPKPAFPNPTVRLVVVNLTDSNLGMTINENILVPPPEFPTDDHYFTAVEWVDDRDISVIWMNRRQNLSIISICSPPTWNCNESYREDMKQLGWVDWYEPPVFNSNGTKYLVRAAINNGEAGIFRHVFINGLTNRLSKALTKGNFEVTKINSFDDESDTIYYTAAPEGKPNERQLYKISSNSTPSDDSGSGLCMTCHLAPDCLFVEAHFSHQSKYYLLECQGPGVPKLYVVESLTNKTITMLESNIALQQHLSTKALPQIKSLKIPIEGGYNADVQLFLPPEFREGASATYPLVINVYGGPGSQKVNAKFDVDWGYYLASNKSIIYAVIDGRGSGYQGENRRFELYRRLGTVEVQDQISVTLSLINKFKFIDKKKIAMWGWSYGGYVTAKVLANDSNIFKCGISVAPVTNWMLYDSVYTERYMGLPLINDNYKGYVESDVLRQAGKFEDNEFYLIHGTADDNVHFQQSLLLSAALEQENIIFRSQVYPDQNHGLYNVQKHLYLSLDNFLDDCFRRE